MVRALRLCAAFVLACGALACGRTLVEPVPGGPEPAVDPLFVAVGNHGKLLISFDGVTWTERQSGVAAHLSGVVAGPSRLVAVGSGGAIVHSPDGLVWREAASPTTLDLRDVVYAGDRFVAVGEDWSAGAVALTSTDGVAWSALDAPATHMFHSVAHADGKLIAAAYLRSDLQTPAQFHRTADGPWIQRDGPDFYASLAARGALVVAGGGLSAVSLSSDAGDSWETHELGTAAPVYGLAFDGTTFVAVGERGAIFSSPDGRTWTSRESPLGSLGTFYAAAHGAGRFVAVGFSGRVVTSADGASWVSHVLNTHEILSDVAYGFGR